MCKGRSAHCLHRPWTGERHLFCCWPERRSHLCTWKHVDAGAICTARYGRSALITQGLGISTWGPGARETRMLAEARARVMRHVWTRIVFYPSSTPRHQHWGQGISRQTWSCVQRGALGAFSRKHCNYPCPRPRHDGRVRRVAADEEPWAEVRTLADETWFVECALDAAMARVAARQVCITCPNMDSLSAGPGAHVLICICAHNNFICVKMRFAPFSGTLIVLL